MKNNPKKTQINRNRLLFKKIKKDWSVIDPVQHFKFAFTQRSNPLNHRPKFEMYSEFANDDSTRKRQ